MKQVEKATPQGDTTKIEQVACHLLVNGEDGICALYALWFLDGLNLHNSISKLRGHHGITIEDKFVNYQRREGGSIRLKRYWVANPDEARKLAELVNHKRKQRGAVLLSHKVIAACLAQFSSNDALTAI
ncbi:MULTISPECIES: hypothetical protein [Aeromonas]|uniref:hypothetical protein n=1 Tax=Aeromonas TaxID=642 RepID=UPI0022E07CC1|nr:hypothetical protein [Aeromonas sp. QDB13]